jgi:hypothetical protein
MSSNLAATKESPPACPRGIDTQMLLDAGNFGAFAKSESKIDNESIA